MRGQARQPVYDDYPEPFRVWLSENQMGPCIASDRGRDGHWFELFLVGPGLQLVTVRTPRGPGGARGLCIVTLNAGGTSNKWDAVIADLNRQIEAANAEVGRG